MLNIPSEVKALFKADSVFKNFHVHFPNGETTDLNNDNIVSESVEFTESLCSQQSFRFGLTEASEIQFTAVGIPNVRGATIECALEICVDDLGAEWLANNAPTGTEDFLDPQVCTYGSRNMYRVPYGRFIVDKCPRNHEGMWKREVTAYTERMDDDHINPFQSRVMNSYHFSDAYQTWEPNLLPLALSLVGNNSQYETILTNYGYTESTAWSKNTSTGGNTFWLKDAQGNSLGVSFAYSNVRYTVSDTDASKNALISIKYLKKRSEDDIVADFVAALENLGVDAVQSGYETMEELVTHCMSRVGPYQEAGRYMNFPEYEMKTGGTISVGAKVDDNVFLLYPRFNDAVGTFRIYADYRVGLSGQGASTYTVIDRYENYTSDAVRLWDIEEDATNVLLNTVLHIGSTLNYYDDSTRIKANRYSFANAISLQGVAQGFLELQCLFGSPARIGGIEITALDKTHSTTIPPADYSSVWYDETSIAPIGTIEATYKDADGNDQQTVITIGDGASTYDMSENAVIGHMVITLTQQEMEDQETPATKIEEFLNAVFVPNIPDLSFVPIELEKKGLPYFEAGDAVTITTGDSQTVPSFILRQTIKGIQFLQADVESANGEAVELIES